MKSTFTHRTVKYLAGLTIIFCFIISCDTKEMSRAYGTDSDSSKSRKSDEKSTKTDNSETKSVGNTTSDQTVSNKAVKAPVNDPKEVKNLEESIVILDKEKNKAVLTETILNSPPPDASSISEETEDQGTTITYFSSDVKKSKKKASYLSGEKYDAAGKNNRGNAGGAYDNRNIRSGTESVARTRNEAQLKRQQKILLSDEIYKLEKKESEKGERTGYDIYTEDEESESGLEEDEDGLAGIANGLDRNLPDVATLYERYNPFNENEWINADDEATSTFSIDVDNASYTNFRRYVNQGQLPPKDAIRMEEWLNYFNYDLEGPSETDEHPLTITTEIGECPWAKEDDLLMIKMQGRIAQEKDLPPSNLVFLVDVSGSMNRPNKLPLVQESMLKLVKKLRPQDNMSIVAYAGYSKIVLEPTSGDKKAKIEKAINSLTSGGGTAGSKGIETAYQLAADNFNANGNNRVILASDGDWNVGITDRNALKKLIEKKRETGIFLSVLGFGMGNLNDAMMETLADNGNGNYAYVDSEKEAERLFNYEFSGTMHVIAKDVKLQLQFNDEEVEEYRLLGYENRVLENWMFNDDKIDAGDLGIGQNVVAFYQVKRKEGSRGKLGKVDFRYKPLGSNVSALLTHEFGKRTKELSTDYKFATCVVEFAMCLRESEYRGTSTMEAAILRGQQNLGDPSGGLSYEKRVEFVGLLDPTSVMWENYVLETAPNITEKEMNLKLFPNPARDYTIVEVPESISDKWSVQIYDMKGGLQRVLHFNKVTQGRMEVGDLTRGTYILKVYSAGSSYGYLRLVKS